MRNCYVPGCDQLCKNNAKRKMFCAPKNKECYDAWMAVLPKSRTFKMHDKVCERHFNKEDICTTYDNVINGLVYKIERGRPRLRLNAVPCRNLHTEFNRTSRRSNSGRKSAKHYETVLKEVKEADPAEIAKRKEENFNVHEEQQLEVEEVHDVQEMQTENYQSATAPESTSEGKEQTVEAIEVSEVYVQELFESLYDDIYEVVLPNTLWGVHRCPERSAIFFTYVDPSYFRTTKMVTVNAQGNAKVLMGNRLLNEQSLVVDINSAETLSNVIAHIDEMKLCARIFDYECCEVTVKEDSELCTSCAEAEQQ